MVVRKDVYMITELKITCKYRKI